MSKITNDYFEGKKVSFTVDFRYKTFLRFSGIRVDGGSESGCYDYYFGGLRSPLYMATGFLSQKTADIIYGMRMHPSSDFVIMKDGGVSVDRQFISEIQYNETVKNPPVMLARFVCLDGDILSLKKETILESEYVMERLKGIIDYDYARKIKTKIIKDEWGIAI